MIKKEKPNLPPLEVLYEDNHLLVVNKPAGVATMGAESGETLYQTAVDYLRKKYNKPGRAFLGIVSRLDAMTSGVLVLAKTSKAAARLAPQFGSAAISAGTEPVPVNNASKRAHPAAIKLYLASVQGPLPASGEFVDFVSKDDSARRMRVVDADRPGAQRASLRFLTVGKSNGVSIVAVQLATGRKHQIRVQFSDRGMPVQGDRKYGSSEPFSDGVALHSWWLQIKHPTRDEFPSWSAPLPPSWNRFTKLVPPLGELQTQVAEHFDLSIGQ